MKIVIAGASGFIGRALLLELQKNYDMIALSRSKAELPQKRGDHLVEWRKCDLFSLLETEKALEGAEIGVYLVHSMMPTAQLTQGTFDDFDLIVADNFLRAAKKANLKQIIYLSGIIPKDLKDEISLHLKSRKEVEDLFLKSGIPTTVLRAAMVLGAEGSSFHIMVRLVQRLPAMICPKWANTRSQPIALIDVINSIHFCIQNNRLYQKTMDIAGPDIISYREMMQSVAKKLNLKRFFVPISVISPKLSRLWIRLVTGAPKNLIDPLILSLKYEMLAHKSDTLEIPNYKFLPFQEALGQALKEFDDKKAPLAFRHPPTADREVRSVQRLPIPKNWTAEDVAKAYIRWLPKLLPWFLSTHSKENITYISLLGFNLNLLILEYAPGRSGADRQLFYIRGGLFARKDNKGRLEFREVKEHNALLAAIHNYQPALPWYIYRWTQALVHLWVMRQFRFYLKTGPQAC